MSAPKILAEIVQHAADTQYRLAAERSPAPSGVVYGVGSSLLRDSGQPWFDAWGEPTVVTYMDLAGRITHHLVLGYDRDPTTHEVVRTRAFPGREGPWDGTVPGGAPVLQWDRSWGL